jgi:hypothetical protein
LTLSEHGDAYYDDAAAGRRDYQEHNNQIVV